MPRFLPGAALTLASLALIPATASAMVANPDPTYGGLGHVRSEKQLSRAGVGGLTEHWEAMRTTKLAGQALIGGESVFLSGTFHGPGVAALDTTTGSTRWSWPGTAESSIAPVRSGDKLIVAEDGDAVVGLDRATGEPVWKASVPGRHEAVVAAFNRIFASTDKEIAVVKSPSGTVRSRIPADGPTRMRVADGRIIATRPGVVESRRPEDGRLHWQHVLPEANVGGRPSTPVYSKGTVFVTTPATDGDLTLYAFDSRKGAFLWREPLTGGAGDVARTDAYSAPVADDGQVYAPDARGTIHAFGRAKGDLRFTAKLGSPLVGDPVVTGGGVVFTATEDDVLRGISNRTGAELWRRDLGARPAAAPAVGNEGVVVRLEDGRTLKFALGASSQRVLDWVKVRGNDLIDLTDDGQVDMLRGYGERRVLSRGVGGADYTVAVDATLRNGTWGYGLFVRAGLDEKGRLSGYSMQFDPGYNLSFIVRHWQDDVEYNTPFAVNYLGPSFDWSARHRTSVTIKGNRMWATVDGTRVLDVPDIEAAILKAERWNAFAPRISGGVGLRAWNSAEVTFHSVTVTGA